MSINGRINCGASLAYPCPTGMMFLIAEDGTHHVPARTGSGNFIDIACAETLTPAATSRTTAQIKADIGTELSVFDGVSFGSELIESVMRIGGPGTSKIYSLSQNFNLVDNTYQILGIRYSVAEEGVLNIDGAVRYFTSTAGLLSGTYGGALGQAVIGNKIYFVGTVGSFGDDFDTCLVDLPLTGDEIDLTPDSWAAKRSNRLPGDMGGQDWWGDTSRDAKNWATVFEHDGGVGVAAYRTSFEGESPSKLFMTVVEAGGGNTGQNDVSSTFGIPFADEGLNFAGDASIHGDDQYTNPIVNVLGSGRLEWIFPRGYSDMDGWFGYRRVTTDSDLSNPTVFDLVQVDLSDVAGTTLEAVHAYREGGRLIWMIREDPALTFLSIGSGGNTYVRVMG